MVKRFERSSEKKFVRTPGAQTKIVFFKGKAKKHHCALCKKILHGVAHASRRYDVSKLSKTQKRPSVPFGGVLCSSCRRKVFIETIKVKEGIKQLQDVSFLLKKFVQMADKKVQY